MKKETFNPSKRKDEKREKIAAALKVLEEADYLTESEFDRLGDIYNLSAMRDFPRWMEERGLIRKPKKKQNGTRQKETQ